MQQERDRVTAAFTANRWAAQASAQAATSRLAGQNTKYASFTIQLQHVKPTPLSKPKPSQSPVTFHGTTNLRHTLHFTTNPQNHRFPITTIWRHPDLTIAPSYKPITLPKFNGKSDPWQFIMSFEAAVASAGGNEAVLAKSFVIVAEGDALAWYSMLRPSSVYS